MLKKFVAFAVVLTMLIINFSSLFSVIAVSSVGDINGDGSVDEFDCLKLKRHVLGLYTLTSAEQSLADINSDGCIDILDYILLKRTVLGTLENVSVVPKKTAISRGKSYTTSVSASSNYEDTYNSELTDGATSTSASFYNGAYCGFSSNVNVIIDLGDDGVDICAFELSYLSTDEAGILPPKSLKIYGSSSASSSGTLLGTVSVPQYTVITTTSVTLNLASTVNYRYIRFSIEKASSWVFIDECYVYAKRTPDVNSNTLSPSDCYYADALTDEQIQTNIASVASGNTYKPLLGESLISTSRYASVTVNASGTDSRCTNSASCLKDGFSTGSAYDSKKWYGINASNPSDIIVNLGSTVYNLNGFSLHCFNRKVSSITLPPYVDISVSTNGYSYTNVGRIYSLSTKQENFAFTLTLDTLIAARYVKFTLAAGSDYYWIEEAQVYQNAAPSNSYVYGNFEMPLAKSSTCWSSSLPDYNTYQNLILNSIPEITSDTSLSLANYYDKNDPEFKAGILTDGVVSDNTDCENGLWFRFYEGGGRNLFFDLKHISSVSSFSVRALKLTSWGISLPASVTLALSENGTDWYVAGQLTLSCEDDDVSYTAKTLDRSYRARYAIIGFPVYSHAFFDEVTVSGTKNASDAVALSTSGLKQYNVNLNGNYIKPSGDLLGGAEDILLVYHNVGTVTKDMIMPYVAYTDKNGNVTDTMYDGFLFLPTPGSLPSGGTPYGTNNVSDWNYLYNHLFISDQNFDALENAVSDAKKLLNMPNYKVQVYITIPHLDSSLYGSSFGDIDGDGKNEDLRSLDTRVYVAKYYAQKFINRFAEKNYKNIEIGGFYWFHEAIDPYGNDAATAKKLNSDFNAMGIDLFWIPYYHATGYNAVSSFGFDAVFYQPNYAFGALIEESRIESATSEAQQYGMSMEMEIDPSALSDIRFFRKYMDYLAGGVKYGYIHNTVLAYYQSFDDIGAAADSKSERVRLIYDYTYDFIKGTLDVKPDAVESLSFFVLPNAPFTNTLNRDNNGVLEYKIAISPKHGTVSVTEDGKFVYYPNKDYVGPDTFTYRVGNYLGWSEECTVIIKVG